MCGCNAVPAGASAESRVVVATPESQPCDTTVTVRYIGASVYQPAIGTATGFRYDFRRGEIADVCRADWERQFRHWAGKLEVYDAATTTTL